MAKKGVSMNMPKNHSIIRKRIPLRCQKKLTNISNGSINATLVTGVYKNKIRTLLKNNRVLAVALQNVRSKKEELLEENKENANIIMFSKLKLSSLSNNFKQIVTVLDETLALLEKHSCSTSIKLTPKHTLSREEFKDQVKEVLMDSIPEEEEPESPQRKSSVSCKNKEQSVENAKEFRIGMPNQKCDLVEKVNSRKSLKSGNLNEKKSKQKSEKVEEDTITCVESYELCESTAAVNNLGRKSSTKTVTQCKRLSTKNKNLTSEVCVKETETKSTTRKRCSIANKKTAWDGTKRITCFDSDKNGRFSSPSKSKPKQSSLHNNIQIYNDTEISNISIENQRPDSTCIPKNSISPNKLQSKIVCNTNFTSNVEKENVSPFKRPKLFARKFKSVDELVEEHTVNKRFRNSALQNVSSKINIENCKQNKSKRRKSCMDDLIATRPKCAELMLTSPKNCDNSKSYLQDITLYQQEMIRNRAENTFLVTAEVHRSPEPPKTDKVKLPQDLSNLKQPIVLVQDIFAHCKSFCKSISDHSCGVLNTIPLERQLLEHCSSLKIIPEESNQSEENSAQNGPNEKEETIPRKRLKNIEPSLSVEEEFIEQQTLHEEKREFRKRSATISYKEPQMNIKLRR